MVSIIHWSTWPSVAPWLSLLSQPARWMMWHSHVCHVLPAGPLHARHGSGKAAEMRETRQSVLLTQCTFDSFSIDLSLCLENTVVTGSVSWFPIPKSTSWCCLFTLPKAFFQAWCLQRVDQSLWSAPRTTQTWQDHQTSLRLFKGNKQFCCQVNIHFYVDDDT